MTEVDKFFVFVFLGEREFKFFFGGLEGGISDFFKIIAFGLFLILISFLIPLLKISIFFFSK